MRGIEISSGGGLRADNCGSGAHLNVVCEPDPHEFGSSHHSCNEGGNLNACHQAPDLSGGGHGHGNNVCCGPGHLVTGGVGGCHPFAGCSGSTNFCGQGSLHTE
jgi:hypothetical protein